MTRYLGQTAMAELPVPDQWVPVLLGLWHSRKIMAEGQGERLLTLCQSGSKERGERGGGGKQGRGCGQDTLSGYATRNLLLPVRFNLLVSVLPPQCHLITSL